MIVPLTRTTKIQKIRTGYIRSVNNFISVVENLVEVQEAVIIPQRSTNRKRLRRYDGLESDRVHTGRFYMKFMVR